MTGIFSTDCWSVEQNEHANSFPPSSGGLHKIELTRLKSIVVCPSYQNTLKRFWINAWFCNCHCYTQTLSGDTLRWMAFAFLAKMSYYHHQIKHKIFSLWQNSMTARLKTSLFKSLIEIESAAFFFCIQYQQYRY